MKMKNENKIQKPFEIKAPYRCEVCKRGIFFWVEHHIVFKTKDGVEVEKNLCSDECLGAFHDKNDMYLV